MTDEVEALPAFHTPEELDAHIAKLEASMREAAQQFEFEKAARLRDTIRDLRTQELLFGVEAGAEAAAGETPPPEPS